MKVNQRSQEAVDHVVGVDEGCRVRRVRQKVTSRWLDEERRVVRGMEGVVGRVLGKNKLRKTSN